MAKGKITSYTADEAANVNMGQIGSAYIDGDSATLTPPNGCVIIAIQIIGSSTGFDVLTAEDATRWVNTAGSAHGSTADDLHGTNGTTLAVDETDLFAPGIVIYGRWTAVATGQGGIIAYFGK